MSGDGSPAVRRSFIGFVEDCIFSPLDSLIVNVVGGSVGFRFPQPPKKYFDFVPAFSKFIWRMCG